MGLGGLLIGMLVVAAAAFLLAKLLSGVTVSSFGAAVVLAVVLALLNATIGWLLSVLAVPLDFITFSLFSGLLALVINAIVIQVADALLKGFAVRNFWWALGFAFLLSLVTGIFNVSYGVSV